MAKFNEGDVLKCKVCGLVVTVNDACGCAVGEIICCDDRPMVKTKAAAGKAQKKPAAKTAAKATAKTVKAAPAKAVKPVPKAKKAPAKKTVAKAKK